MPDIYFIDVTMTYYHFEPFELHMIIYVGNMCMLSNTNNTKNR